MSEITTLEALKNAYTPICELKHPQLGISLFFRIKKGLNPLEALKGGVPLPNPLLKVVAEETPSTEKKESLLDLDPIEFYRRVAALALIEPTYIEIESEIKDDLWLLNEIMKLSTGFDLLGVAGLSDTFQKLGGSIDLQKQLVKAGKSK